MAHLVSSNSVEGEGLVILRAESFTDNPGLTLVLLLGQQLQLDVGITASYTWVTGWQVSGTEDAYHQSRFRFVVFYTEAQVS